MEIIYEDSAQQLINWISQQEENYNLFLEVCKTKNSDALPVSYHANDNHIYFYTKDEHIIHCMGIVIPCNYQSHFKYQIPNTVEDEPILFSTQEFVDYLFEIGLLDMDYILNQATAIKRQQKLNDITN